MPVYFIIRQKSTKKFTFYVKNDIITSTAKVVILNPFRLNGGAVIMTSGLVYGGGQVPSANYITGGLETRLLHEGHEVYAIKQSFMGMSNETCYEKVDFIKAREVLNFPGTYLGTCRNVDPSKDEWFPKIIENLGKFKIDNLFVIGGDGSARACFDFSKRCKAENYNVNIYFIPCTIDGMNGTLAFGEGDAVQETINHIRMSAINAWATFDYGKAGPRVSIVEVQGRNRNDIAVDSLKQLLSAGVIAHQKLTEVNIIFLASGYNWSAKSLLESINNSRPTLIIASEGTKPIEKWWKWFFKDGSIGAQLEKFINKKSNLKANLEKVAYLSQTNECRKECNKIDMVLDKIDFKNLPEGENALIIKNWYNVNFIELMDFVKLNPNSKEPVKLDRFSEIILEPYMNV